MCPVAWKVAKVTPIHKDGDRSDPGNDRPISVLPTVSKIMGHIVHGQLSDYLDRNSILSNSKHGFRKHHSIETCCLPMLDRMYKAMDEGKVGGVVFLDLKKAFDTVNHNWNPLVSQLIASCGFRVICPTGHRKPRLITLYLNVVGSVMASHRAPYMAPCFSSSTLMIYVM